MSLNSGRARAVPIPQARPNPNHGEINMAKAICETTTRRAVLSGIAGRHRR
jgi:hypothetical protein